LGEQELLVKPKRRTVRTTRHDPTLPVFQNLISKLTRTKPNEVWVSDVTFVNTHEGPIYLSLITDLFSRRIVGWHSGARNRAYDSLKALRMAIADLSAECCPIHHSDRGSQYCSHDYVAVLQEHSMPISMTEQNHCYENCYAERVNGILKDEFNLDHTFRTRAQARTAIAQAISIYNTRRLHTSLQLRTPDDVYHHTAA
jgi:transposase InsO family protein